MNEHAARAYLELCRETVLDQNRRERACVSKAAGIATLSMVLLGVLTSLDPWSQLKDGVKDGVLDPELALMLAIFGLMICFTGCILSWVYRSIIDPEAALRYNVESAEEDARNTASGQKAAQTLVEFAEYYRDMIDYNEMRLIGKSKWLKNTTMIFLWQLGILLAFGLPFMVAM